MFSDRAIRFYKTLTLKIPASTHVELIEPYSSPEVRSAFTSFFTKFYADTTPRIGIFGINPGRFGGGITGINFTDPVALQEDCGIPNQFAKRREISAEFVYRAINGYGGVQKFFGRFFLAALSPIGFTKGGKNFNFYDEPAFYSLVEPFVIESIKKQIALGLSTEVAIVLGTGTNKKIFEKLNAEHGFFKNVHYLEHPRFIMQYKRKHLPLFLEKYKEVLDLAWAESTKK